jgi:lipoprotein-anchoring transpeptidase ErfK/SrfK
MPASAIRAAVVACVAAVLLSGCSAVQGLAPTLELTTATIPTTSSATISAEIAEPVQLGQPLAISADGGRLSEVTVTGPKGPVEGEMSADGRSWLARPNALQYSTSYRVRATAIDTRGVPTETVTSFRTIEPRELFSARISPDNGAVVGVGTPITITFDESVRDRAAIERALVVRTPTPLEGAWSWKSSTTVVFRPAEYWPSNTPVQVDLNLMGVRAKRGVFGESNISSSFTTGVSMVTKVDAIKHTATVYRDGQKIRTIPITTGKPGFETRSGILIITTKEPTRVMDAATGGTDSSDPEYYRIEVHHAMRITSSGEFLHGAPWSVGSQGRANVSHGCVGMSSSNAQWLFEQSSLGDVVEITGTGVPQNLGNGITVWTEAWSQWLSNSATGPVWTTADPELVAAAPSAAPSASASVSDDASAGPSASSPAA